MTNISNENEVAARLNTRDEIENWSICKKWLQNEVEDYDHSYEYRKNSIECHQEFTNQKKRAAGEQTLLISLEREVALLKERYFTVSTEYNALRLEKKRLQYAKYLDSFKKKDAALLTPTQRSILQGIEEIDAIEHECESLIDNIIDNHGDFSRGDVKRKEKELSLLTEKIEEEKQNKELSDWTALSQPMKDLKNNLYQENRKNVILRHVFQHLASSVVDTSEMTDELCDLISELGIP